LIYANDNNKAIADWLGKLPLDIDFIDTRSITEVQPDDVRKYTQCHFFAGIGGWPLALRMAEWPDDVPVWSGSCPCQPFSAAGKRKGTSDERHLWPEFRRLIAEVKPPAIFGEQVSSKAGRDWLSVVRSEMEKLGYEFGAADLCVASVGSPHIRQRLFWVAYSDSWRFQEQPKRNSESCLQEVDDKFRNDTDRCGDTFGLANTGHRESGWSMLERPDTKDSAIRLKGANHTERCGENVWLAYATGERPQGSERSGERTDTQFATTQRSGEAGWMGDASVAACEWNAGDVPSKKDERSGAWIEDGHKRLRPSDASEAHWDGLEFIYCRDDKWRPVKSSIFPLVNGVSAILADGTTYGKKDLSRAVALHGIGNSIVPQVAAVFIKTVMAYLGVK